MGNTRFYNVTSIRDDIKLLNWINYYRWDKKKSNQNKYGYAKSILKSFGLVVRG